MSGPQNPFKSDYSAESNTTLSHGDIGNMLPPVQRTTVPSQTISSETPIIPPTNQLIEPERYGIGKPRRIVIRGKISRE